MMTSIKVGDKLVPTKLLTVREYLDISNGKLNGKFKEAVLTALESRGFADLPKHIAQQIITQLIIESLDKKITLVKEHECGNHILAHVDTHNVMVSDETDLKFDFGNIKFQLRYPKLFEDEDLIEMFYRCVEYVEVNGMALVWDELSETETQQVIDTLELKHIRQMVSELVKPTAYVAMPVKCECGETVAVVASGLDEIFKYVGN